MKPIVFFLFLCLSLNLSAQWKYKSGSNKFDGDYKVAYVQGKGNDFPYTSPMLGVAKYDNEEPYISVSGIGYTGCSDRKIIVVFEKSEERFSVQGGSNSNDDAVFLKTGFEETSALLDVLKEDSKVYIRYVSSCGSKDFSFGLNGSTRAIDFVVGSYFEEQAAIRKKQELAAEKEAEQKKLVFDTLIEETKVLLECDKDTVELIRYGVLYNNTSVGLNSIDEDSNLKRTLYKHDSIIVFNKVRKNTILIRVKNNTPADGVYFIDSKQLWKTTDLKYVEAIKSMISSGDYDCRLEGQ